MPLSLLRCLIRARWAAPLAVVWSLCGAGAQAAPTICVWDPLGAAGQVFDGAKTYALAMQKHGADIAVRAYSDERIAADDFRVGQCQGLLATSLRTKP